MLVVGGVALALLTTLVVPAFAAGPGWGPGAGAGVQAPQAGPRPGVRPGPGFQPGAGRGPGAGGFAATVPADVHKAIETAVRAAAARVLKITPDALDKEMAAGKTMAAIAAAKNVSLDTVRNAMLNARKFAVGQALQAGKITKAQADTLLQAGPRWGATGRPGVGPVLGTRHGMGPGAGARPGMGRRPGHMRNGMRRYGPGR
jgi:hypothetical protein